MKILVEVITPGNGKSYELILDDKMSVGSAKEKIIEQIVAFENGCIDFDSNAVLFSHAVRTQLPDYRNLHKAGVYSGHKLYLL